MTGSQRGVDHMSYVLCRMSCTPEFFYWADGISPVEGHKKPFEA